MSRRIRNIIDGIELVTVTGIRSMAYCLTRSLRLAFSESFTNNNHSYEIVSELCGYSIS